MNITAFADSDVEIEFIKNGVIIIINDASTIPTVITLIRPNRRPAHDIGTCDMLEMDRLLGLVSYYD